MRPAVLFATLASVVGFTNASFAADEAAPEECAGPCLIYEGSADFTAAWLHPSDAAIGNSYLLLPTSENSLRLKANDSFSIMTNIVSEQTVDPVEGENQLFSGLGTYVDVLQAQYDVENMSIWGGKIHPAFGRAADVTPGLHGTDLAEVYDLAERIGGGASVSFDAFGLSNTLQASAFTVDRTILSQSLFNNRGRTTLADGGAGNTNGVSSFALALDGCLGAETEACYDEGSFGYQLATRYQKGGAGSDGNELGFLGSLNKSFTLADDTTLRLFGEAAWFRNFDGTADNALVLTGSGALQMGLMTYSLAYSQQRMLVGAGGNTTEHLIDATMTYDLGDTVSLAGEQWKVGAGYSYASSDGENVQTVGLKLAADFGGNIPFGNRQF
jgi:hypothetical protein